MLAEGMVIAMPLKALFTLQTMQHLISRGVTRKTAKYAIEVAKKKGRRDPECADPTYIMIGWCAT